ncbi:MAG: EAL domain-containing protein [Gammaproteobacteria bacterium]|nr:EAL domain-containing protein [Gammaproteobacteria bacterium]
MSLHADELKPLLQPLTVEQGLSRGSIRNLLIDKDGFLWTATSNGLNRFDATRNLIVGADDPKFSGLAFNQVFEHLPNQIWAVASQVGIFRIDKTTGDIRLILDLSTQEQLELPSLTVVIVEDMDHFLVAINGGVYRYSIPSHQLTELFNLRQANIELGVIRQLWRHQDQLLVGSNHGLFSVDLKTRGFQPILLELDSPKQEQPLIRHLYATDDQLFISGRSSVYRVPLAELEQPVTQWQPKRILRNIQVMRMLQHQQHLLLATSSGLFKYDESTDNTQFLWRFSQGNQEIGQDIITDLVATTDGGLWLASRDDGVYYWHPRSTAFTNIRLQNTDQRSDNQSVFNTMGAMALAEAKSNQLWVGSGLGLQLLDLPTGLLKKFDYPDDIPADFGQIISRIYPQTDDKLWLRSINSLRYFSTTEQQFLPAPLIDTTQHALLTAGTGGHWRDAQGDFWFYNLNQYYRYRPALGIIEPLPGLLEKVPPQLAGRFLGTLPNQPAKMVLSANDQLWLYDIEQQQAQLMFQTEDYQPSLVRYADKMSIDPNGILWITFDGIGLLGFDSDLKLKHFFNEQYLLLSNNVYSCELDDQGHLWFSGNYGLSRLDTSTFRVEHFSRKDGLASQSFNRGASTKLSNGSLVFGSRQGLTLVDASRFVEQPTPPQIAITAIRGLNKPVSAALGDLNGQSFSFNYNVPGIEVQFSSLNFRDSSKISYRLWLDGAQKLEYPLQTAPQIVFPQLQPGQYRFFVAAVSPTTGLESTPAQINITITAAPWRTQAAYFSYAALLLIFTLLWWRNRRRQRRLLAQAHKKVKISEQRLKQALEAVDSGAWEWHSHKNSIYAHRVHSMLGYNEALDPLTMQQHLSLIHAEDRESYQQAWQRFTSAPDKTFDHSYRMQHKNGHWLWFRDIGKVTEFSSHQKIERVIGTYSNITETRATKEKARLFGEAFQQTRDWVVLLDLEQRVMAANQSFSDVFGNMDEYLSNPRAHDLGISLNRRRFYTKLLAGMTVNQHWQGEELVHCPDGAERPTLINITAVGEDLQVEFFVLVFTDITAQKQAEDDLRYLASYDTLTGLPNRALLMDRIYHGIEQAKREQRSLALCFIDLDKFKQINDSLGHDIGDLLLKKVARRLTDTLRLTDTVARLGGDEFVVLLEAYKNDDNISHVARKMIKTIGEPMQLGAHTVSVSPSIGIAVFPEDALDAKELLKHADVAMYHAKDNGRNNFQFFINEMNEKAYMQLARETKLRSAYQQDEFYNVYQPIYDSRQQKVVGAEVLMRWQSLDGLVPPSEFIPLAEDLNLIIPMTLTLLERALCDVQQWYQAGYQLYLSVNLSTRHLEQENLAILTGNLLQKYQLPASCLRFEVTESALMQDHESAIATMLALSELGILLALDDFGTGYSSLKYLKELPIDAIKIDRSFVKDIGIDSNDETIIDAMLSMANSLGMYCIAEGVETEQQLAFFTQRQCYLIQGYLFGKPMPAVEFSERLASERELG